MVRILSFAMEAVSAIITLFPAAILLYFTIFRNSGKKKLILLSLFALYLSAVFSVVGLPSVLYFTFQADLNYIPFVDILNMTSVLNIILFIPLGFLLPTIWSDFRSLKKTVLVGFSLSLTIELLQLFTFRLTDVDDLITNTLGTALGYFLSVLLSEKLRLKLPVSPAKREVLLLFVSVFFVMATIQPLLLDGLWSILMSSPLWERIH